MRKTYRSVIFRNVERAYEARMVKRMRDSQRANALATTCGARMRDGSRAPCLLRLCAPRFAHRTCTLYVLSSSSSSSAARHRTLEDSRDRHDLNQPEIHRVPRIREFYPRQPFLTNTIKKRKERNKERSIVASSIGDLESPSPSPSKKIK